ncbi:MAG: SPFH domain-containing protein [Candidatus Nealsonbacteria bacterium]|nr:SPFH domain-containing protein [Candidatus Nealsonbacteria bacterium]
MFAALLFVLVVAVGLFIFGLWYLWNSFQQIPQQERWVVERLGRYVGVRGPGPTFVLHWLERVSDGKKVSILERSLPLFKGEKIDFQDGTSSVEATAYIVVRDNPADVWRSVYTVANLEPWAESMIENALRPLFHGKTIDQALAMRGDLLTQLPVQISPQALADLVALLAEKGLELKRAPLEDVDLPPDVIAARQLPLQAQKAKDAAVIDAAKRAITIFGTVDELRKQLEATGQYTPDEAKNLAVDLWKFLQAVESKRLVYGATGFDQFISALGLLGISPGGKTTP